MAYKKPQDPLTNNGFGIYPLTTADQVILSDGSRLEKAGKINADKLDGRTLAEIMLALYPVGSIYISVASTSPASLFGGEWTPINGRFLIGTGAPDNNNDGTSPGSYNYAAGSTGGDATHYHGTQGHTLTIAEIPSHNHDATYQINWGNPTTLGPWVPYYKDGTLGDSGENGETINTWSYHPHSSTGGSQSHSHGNTTTTSSLPPYLAVYMWKRVS